MMGELAHSPLGGSSLKRWSACPGSIKMCRDIPAQTSIYAQEGTRAHEVAAHYLEQREWAKDIDLKTLLAVEVYTKEVDKHWMRIYPNGQRWIEKKFSLNSIHPSLFGTADCVIYDSKERCLSVYDYKHGRGVAVEVLEDGKPNFQLMYYALGAALTVNMPIRKIELIVIQPRCPHKDGPIRRHSLDAMELLEFSADLKDYAYRTEEEKPVLHSGEHCRFCPALSICPEIKANPEHQPKYFRLAVRPDPKTEFTAINE